MYNPQFFMAQMNQQPTLPPTPFANPHHYRAPSSGPSRNCRNRRNKGFRKTEPLNTNQLTHESSGTVIYDSSTGVDPGQAQINTNNNTGKGKVWRTPSKNYWWLTATYSSRGDTGGVLATRWNPLFSWSPPRNWKVSWFSYPSGINHLINNS